MGDGAAALTSCSCPSSAFYSRVLRAGECGTDCVLHPDVGGGCASGCDARAPRERASPRELGLPHGDGERDSFMIGEEHCGEPRPSSLFRRREMLKSGMLAPLAVSRRGARAACA